MKTEPFLVAHMGLSASYPENTLCALEKALDYPVNGIEFDLHPTKDGRIVACHDDTVDRRSNGTGLIREMTFEEIRKLDFGIWKGPQFAGTQTPEFKEILDMVQIKCPSVWLCVEIKEYDPECTRAILQELDRYHSLDRCSIISWIPEVLFQVHNEYPAVITHGFEVQEGVLTGQQEKEYYAFLKRIGFHHTIITSEIVKKYHDMGIWVDVWAPDDPETYEAVKAKGVDSITTNACDVITKYLAAKK